VLARLRALHVHARRSASAVDEIWYAAVAPAEPAMAPLAGAGEQLVLLVLLVLLAGASPTLQAGEGHSEPAAPASAGCFRMDEGWIEAVSVDDVFERHPPFALKIVLANITNTCAASHGPVGLFVLSHGATVLLTELTHAHDEVMLTGVSGSTIGHALGIGVLPRGAAQHALAAVSRASDLAILDPVGPLPLEIHQPAFRWTWPRDGSVLAPSSASSPAYLQPRVEAEDVLDLLVFYSCRCKPALAQTLGTSDEHGGSADGGWCEVDCSLSLTVDGGLAWQVRPSFPV